MSLTPRIDRIEDEIYSDKIDVSKIDVPFTEIVDEQGNPRQIADLANNMKVSMGIERLTFNKLSQETKEFGSNGETVYKTNDDRIRFVGDWINQSTTHGQRPSGTIVGDYIEITFYGTGLNITTLDGSNTTDYRVSIDGGVEGSNIFPNGSQVIGLRNYATNAILPIASGLSLGIHTIKIRLAVVDFLLNTYGCEILNESVQLAVNPGTPRLQDRELLSQQLLNYNSDFDDASDTLGTKGGRVLVYQNIDNEIKKRLTATDITPQYLTLTDHSTEEILRRINWREFGNVRGDDFSTLGVGASDRAFTLDDGTTSLVGDDVLADTNLSGNFRPGGAQDSSHFTLTFIGTGLDITVGRDGTISDYDHNVYVDGILVAADSPDFNGGAKTVKVCSGLPYGTHTIKIERGNSVSAAVGFGDFIIYGPKKPELESTDIVLSDYNIMADFVANTVAGIETISVGCLRKQNMREWIYSGAGWVTALDLAHPSGFYMNSSSNVSAQYTFFGTGFDFRFRGTVSYSNNVTVDVDGSTNFTSLDTSVYGGATFNDATGTLNPIIGNNINNGLVISGLALGLHTVTLTNNNAPNNISVLALDIITPIHINDTQTGSLGLKDLRNAVDITESVTKNKVDLTKAKAWVTFNAVTMEIESSYNVAAILKPSGSRIYNVYFKRPFKNKSYVGTGGGSSNPTPISGNDGQQFDLMWTDPNYARIGYAYNTGVGDGNNYTSQAFYYGTAIFFGELENEEDIDLGDL